MPHDESLQILFNWGTSAKGHESLSFWFVFNLDAWCAEYRVNIWQSIKLGQIVSSRGITALFWNTLCPKAPAMYHNRRQNKTIQIQTLRNRFCRLNRCWLAVAKAFSQNFLWLMLYNLSNFFLLMISHLWSLIFIFFYSLQYLPMQTWHVWCIMCSKARMSRLAWPGLCEWIWIEQIFNTQQRSLLILDWYIVVVSLHLFIFFPSFFSVVFQMYNKWIYRN